MRRLAGLAIVLGCGAAQAAAAQTAAPVAPASPVNQDHIADLLHREAFLPGEGPLRWTGGQVEIGRSNGAVDGLRVSVGGALKAPGGLPLNLDRAEFAPRDYEIAVTRDWPNAVRFGNGRVDLDVSPHAGVGMTSQGGSAEAGARMELSRSADDDEDKLKSLGVKDGSAFGDKGRWYLFAAASGKAVGLNMLRGEGGWDRAGWTMDPQSTLISDAQLGVGWRKDHVQTSFGLVHREVKGKHMIMGQETKDDTLVAFSLSIKPRR